MDSLWSESNHAISWNIFHNHTLRVCPSDDQIKCTIPSVGWGCHIYLRPIETSISVRDGSFLVTVRWVTDIQRNFTWILSIKTNSTITPIRLLQAPLPCELIQVWSCITALQGYGGCNMSSYRNAVYNINPWGATIFLLELKKIKPKSSFNAIELNYFLNSEVRLRSHMAIFVNVNAVRKYNFVDSFLFWFVYKTFAVTIDSKYHSLNWKDVSVTNVDMFEQPRPQGAFPWLWRERGKSALGTRLIFEKNQFSLQFFHSLLQVYIVYRVAFIFHLKAFLVAVWLKDSLICFADRGEGKWDWYVRGDFYFTNFTTFLIFFFFENFFLPTTFNHTHTHDPLPTSHDI